MRVSIDAARCCGNLECVRIARDVFEEGPAGLGVVKVEQITHGQAGMVREAVQSCPAGAIEISDLDQL